MSPIRILKAGLLAGLVDFAYASILGVVVLHRPFSSVWQGVASGWLGPAAGKLGAPAVALGIVTHFAIATTMAAVFALAALKVRFLTRQPLLSGAAYVYVVRCFETGGVRI